MLGSSKCLDELWYVTSEITLGDWITKKKIRMHLVNYLLHSANKLYHSKKEKEKRNKEKTDMWWNERLLVYSDMASFKTVLAFSLQDRGNVRTLQRWYPMLRVTLELSTYRIQSRLKTYVWFGLPIYLLKYACCIVCCYVIICGSNLHY
jgi:hypothetical protein